MSAMSLRASVLACAAFAMTGCQGEPPVERTPHVEKPAVDTPSASSLARDADKAFEASLELDYREPFTAEGHDRTAVRTLYVQACRSGDTRSCWMVQSMVDHAGNLATEDVTSMIRDHCRAGDRTSCRALTKSDGPDSLPGSEGRRCEHDLKCTIDAAKVREECRQGFPRSCVVATRIPNLPEPDWHVASERATKLAHEGCTLGILDECRLAQRDVHQRRAAQRRMCELALHECEDYSTGLGLVDADPSAYRDVLEHMCQRSRPADRVTYCQSLISGYRHNDYPEPMPGRRAALLEWAAQHGIGDD